MKNRLEALRKARGIKQEELAEALEVSRQTIGSLENGRYNPSILPDWVGWVFIGIYLFYTLAFLGLYKWLQRKM